VADYPLLTLTTQGSKVRSKRNSSQNPVQVHNGIHFDHQTITMLAKTYLGDKTDWSKKRSTVRIIFVKPVLKQKTKKDVKIIHFAGS
jgi:hypothetical protein